MTPSVVTAAGNRLLLNDTSLVVRWDEQRQAPVASNAAWWLVNYPFNAIKGLESLSVDEAARKVTGMPASEIRNWWMYTPGSAGLEPANPSGPAPIEPAKGQTLIIVDQREPAAKDDNPGTADRPLRTIAAAAERLGPGVVVRVKPGIYREEVKVVKGGTAQAPAIIEGVRDPSGKMPVISANDVLDAAGWVTEKGVTGVYRHPNESKLFGTVSVDGVLLEERDLVRDLAPGQVVVNRSSHEFAFPRIAGGETPVAGEMKDGKEWTPVKANEKDLIALTAGNSIYYLSAWVWVDPGQRKAGEIFDPTAPRPIGGDLLVGQFRAFRQTGSALANQINQFRFWLNRQPMSCVPGLGRPSPSSSWGDSGDTVKNFALTEGWNHLLIQLDTTTRPKDLSFQLKFPQNIGNVRCAVAKPTKTTSAPEGVAASPYLTQALLLGPFPASPDYSIYARLPGNRDPKQAVVDLAARPTAANLNSPFVQLRGFELRHGMQFQQRALVNLKGAGTVLEGCLVREPEWTCVNVNLEGGDQSSPPITVRGNWLIGPGSLGIGGGNENDVLSASDLERAPGRRRLVAEWNRIVDNNRMGNERWWESGAIKLCKNTGAVIRQNDFIGGDGPGVWLDWENYGIRIEGNRSIGVTAFLAGVEASPGPVLIGSNIAIDTRPGDVWFRSAVLAWSSAQVWAVNNTIDGRWNSQDAHWEGQDGADGIYLDEGGSDRQTRWGVLPSRRQVILNNLITGCDVGILVRHDKDLIQANIQDTKRNSPSRFRNAPQNDYRVGSSNMQALSAGTIAAPEARALKYDFYGLPFGDQTQRPVGACRIDPPIPAGASAVIQVETTDRRLLTIIRNKP